jgi:lactate permease
MLWTQNYDPFASAWLSPLVAAVPIIVLLGLLATGRVPAQWAALLGLLSALAAAIFGFAPAETLDPEGPGRAGWAITVLAAAGNGAAFGLFPIGWIVVSAIFLYNLTVSTGHFDVVKRSVLALSDDRRIQALLIAFCFGAFIEGAAGFGTPVAISAALLMGAGFRPLHAAGLALLANTSPVAFGALGTPIIMLADVTGLDVLRLSSMAGRQLPFFSLVVPVWLVWVMSGWRGVWGVWPALLVCGGSFALVQFLTANLHGPWLVDVVGGLVSLVCLSLFLCVWQPRQRWTFPDESAAPVTAAGPALSRREVIAAWVPWLLLTAFVFAWGLKPVKAVFAPLSVPVQVPALHQRVLRTPPVVPADRIEDAVYRLDLLGATGTSIFLAAVLSALWLGVGPRRFLGIAWLTLTRLRWPLFTIVCMLAIAYTTRYSGLDAALGLAFTKTGVLYPLFAALLGWLGVALTGSDTSSNALFGSLQTVTAQGLVADGTLGHLGAEQAKVLLASANSTGGVMGKMIDAQSIVVSAAATQQPGQEGPILRFVFWHSVVLAVLMGLLVMAQAYWWPGMIP